MKPLPIVLVVLAVICFVAAVLYLVGALQLFASGSGTHTKHAIVMAVLGIALLVGANFARRRPA